jgi:hypothetical protein
MQAYAASPTTSSSASIPSVPPSPVAKPFARLRYVHLYMPLITVALIITNSDIVAYLSSSSEDQPQNADGAFLVALSAIPTYLVASFLYPRNLPTPSQEESVRFTRKHDFYRAVVIASYGRLYGTPFNLQFVIADVACSYAMGAIIGERPTGARQRRSEFFVALLWLVGSGILCSVIPSSMGILLFLAGAFDRTVWRTAYVALVDDIVGVLSRPNVRTFSDKFTVVLLQSFTITSLVYFALALANRITLAGNNATSELAEVSL